MSLAKSWRTTVAASARAEGETEVRILYNLPVVIQQICSQMMAGQGIFRNELNRAFSHLGREQWLAVVTIPRYSLHGYGWKMDEGS